MQKDGQQIDFVELYLQANLTAASPQPLPSQDLLAMEELFRQADIETIRDLTQLNSGFQRSDLAEIYEFGWVDLMA